VSRRWLVALTLLVATTVGGCSLTPTATGRSSIEQRLLARSLERAVAQIDISRFEGKRVYVDLVGLTPDQSYARVFVIAELRQRGVVIVEDASTAEVRLQVLVPGLGVDWGETLVGVPETAVPLLSIPVLEIALFKWVRHRGMTEVTMYAWDNTSGRAFESNPSALGRSRYDQFTILLFFRFRSHDLDVKPEPTTTTTSPPAPAR
jgi:hypothetical protein